MKLHTAQDLVKKKKKEMWIYSEKVGTCTFKTLIFFSFYFPHCVHVVCVGASVYLWV